ncbi:MAG: bifunctional diguanylate cyclase/phosphodiesterase [Gammaproteobacteria bacterium]
MNTQLLAELDLEAYRRVLAVLAGPDCELRLDALDGTPLASTRADPVPLPVPVEASGQGAEILIETLGDGTVLRRCLDCLPGGEAAWLGLDIGATPAHEPLRAAFAAVAQLVLEACVRIDVLNGMSIELATRYEELNLVYDLDRRRGGSAGDERTTLHELIDAARAHLRVDLALLHVPDQHITLDCSALEHAYTAHELRTLGRELLAQLRDDPATLVINRDRIYDWKGSELVPDLRLCATPVCLDGEVPSGVLLFAKHVDGGQFTNSDRRMSEVVAAEIVKVMQHSRDPLTGAYNRRGLEALLEQVLARPDWLETHALMLVDIDRFQMINTQLGISGADELLRQFAQVLPRLDAAAAVRVARIAADEFALLVTAPGRADVEAFAERVRVSMKQLAFFHQGSAVEITVSVGAAIVDDRMPDTATAFEVADTSLREAKAAGGNAVAVHAASDAAVGLQREAVDVVSLLKRALRDDLFELHGQLISRIAGDDDMPYFEVLVRLRDPAGALVSPGRFIPVAERFNLMPEIDAWIVAHTIALMGRHQRGGGRPFRVAVNLSGQSLCDAEVASTILAQLARHDIAPARFGIEVTETAAIANLNSGLEVLYALREAGCRISLDDFGSGMSSFGYLRNLPVDVVKLDGAFVSKMTANPFDRTFVDVINRLAHALELQTVAEFVEDHATWCMLRDLHIDYVQGYHIDKPALLLDKLAALAAAEHGSFAHAG